MPTPKFLSPLILGALSLLATVAANLPDGRPHANMVPPPLMPLPPSVETHTPSSFRTAAFPPLDTTYYFDQLIDHSNPDLGTFQQRYWYNYEFYQPGGPIILCTPGEANAAAYTPYLTNATFQGVMAQQNNGSVIIFEHRFYGESNPRPDLSVESLQYLTIEQAIDDLVYFAEHVVLPMPGGDQVGPDKVPWILFGGSYSGALTSWTMRSNPGVFWAGHASSAVVQTILDFWQYFEPVRNNMPSNCSADAQAVLAHIDEVFASNDTESINEIKDAFGLLDVIHLDDVAGALRNNMWDWQNMQPSTGPGARFYQFCDAMEVRDGVAAPAEGWGVDHALPAWADFFKNRYLGMLCGGVAVEDCVGTYDPSLDIWNNIRVDNWARSWMWTVCNEVGWLQTSPPDANQPSLVSRLIQPEYDLHQCSMYFPDAFPNPPTPTTGLINDKYDGWDVKIDRIFFVNAVRDTWLDATISATGLNVESTDLQRIAVSDAFHCSEFNLRNSAVDPSVAGVQQEALTAMKEWLALWNAA